MLLSFGQEVQINLSTIDVVTIVLQAGYIHNMGFACTLVVIAKCI